MKTSGRYICEADRHLVVSSSIERYQALLMEAFIAEGIDISLKQSLKDSVEEWVLIMWDGIKRVMPVSLSKAQNQCFLMAMDAVLIAGRHALDTGSTMYFDKEAHSKLKKVLDRVADRLSANIEKYGFGTRGS